ncbi:MAG TPA: hypothetical protein VJ964_04395 [Balneolaceae bacterium]|nr:hypothetical protein [Balneolaceae bacterium]
MSSEKRPIKAPVSRNITYWAKKLCEAYQACLISSLLKRIRQV